MPLARLVSPAHAAALRAALDAKLASSSSATPLLLEGEHTTHFAVVDEQGMVVALTTTLNTSFGSALVVSGAGFLLNNEMDDFASKPGVANAYGLVQGTANKIEPGKRMLSSMSPTIVCDAEGKPVMVVGAAGGSRIPTAVFQMISNVLDHGFDVGKAVGARRVHHQHLPDVVVVEAGALTHEAWDALGALGHKRNWAKWPIAVGPAIVRQGAEWTGAVDPRDSGLALGY
jgi:gamma-glutamyltranspeptidase/glutathione hydrolase